LSSHFADITGLREGIGRSLTVGNANQVLGVDELQIIFFYTMASTIQQNQVEDMSPASQKLEWALRNLAGASC
jgi:hypothetical protein